MRIRTARWWLGLCVLATACATGSDVIDPNGSGDGGIFKKKDAATDPDASTDPDAGMQARVCRTLDDCTGPDLCTNAQACRANRCVVVGGAAGCDDGVDCTNDTCDAEGGRCTHTADDGRCGAGRYCSGAGGCVDIVPCTMDAECAALTGDACTGTWTCDTAQMRCARARPFDCDDVDPCTVDTCATSGTMPTCAHGPADLSSDPNNCGTCGMPCARGPHQTATCSSGTCGYTCEAGFVDVDGSPATGCECSPTVLDFPDVMFEDTNCDGVDGDAARAVFVSPRGSDMGDGTMARPLRTLGAAVAAAAAATPAKSVYAAVGVYAETVVITTAVSVYGGFDDARGWTRTRDSATVLDTESTGLVVRGVTSNMELQMVLIRSAAAMRPGDSSFGVRVLGSSGQVRLNRCAITVGNGGNGSAGTSGVEGMPGGVGGGASGTTPGAPGASMCGGAGGGGGPGVVGRRDGIRGSDGQNATGGFGTGGSLGARGGGCCSSTEGRNAPPDAREGTAGAVGAHGMPAAMIGTFRTDDGTYVPATAGAGMDGSGGGGGGGGGGSGGGDESGGICIAGCSDGRSGAGGGGGGGGCSGTGGTGGGSGGASIAVLSIASTVRIDESVLITGRGGAGGSGGAGGTGGPGGAGGPGGFRTRTAGNGAAGARGGNGGNGGGGGGGAGGPAVCVYSVGTAATVGPISCMRAGGGPGGLGGNGAPNGPSGASDITRTSAM